MLKCIAEKEKLHRNIFRNLWAQDDSYDSYHKRWINSTWTAKYNCRVYLPETLLRQEPSFSARNMPSVVQYHLSKYIYKN